MSVGCVSRFKRTVHSNLSSSSSSQRLQLPYAYHHHKKSRMHDQVLQTWEVPENLKQRTRYQSVDFDGFGSNWKRHWIRCDDKLKRRKEFMKGKQERLPRHAKLARISTQLGGAKHTKSNIRKARKTLVPEVEIAPVSHAKSEEYLDILQRIRDGYKHGNHVSLMRKPQKHLADAVIDMAKVRDYRMRIKNLHIMEVYRISHQSELPNMQRVTEWHDALTEIHCELTAINSQAGDGDDGEDNRSQNSVFHLDLYTKLLLAFGKIARVHQMMSVYRELKTHNLHVSNKCLMAMLSMMDGHTISVKRLWNEYLNDFRKGKIAERPSIELFHAFMRECSRTQFGAQSSQGMDVAVLFQMMTEEFGLAPDHETCLYLLRAYALNAPPRYKSSQKLLKAMKEQYGLTPSIQHYAQLVHTLSTPWGHFNALYKKMENVDDAYLAYYKHGIELGRIWKLVRAIMQRTRTSTAVGDAELTLDDSGLISGLLKACMHANGLESQQKMQMMDALFRKYVLLEQLDGEHGDHGELELHAQQQQIAGMKIESDACSMMMRQCFKDKHFERAKEYFETCTADPRVASRFEVDETLFCTLIAGIACDIERFNNRRDLTPIALARIHWIEQQMSRHGIVCTQRIWQEWFLATRIYDRFPATLKTVVVHLLSTMDGCRENVRYFEFDAALLQSVVAALYVNDEMEKALQLYGKYYQEIALFSHWELKSSGQKQIDFHGFRAGFACVALRWILQNEYPPLNISKYLLQQYGDKNPNLNIIIGQGHHNPTGQSHLYKSLMRFIKTLEPSIRAERYPTNPGQFMVNGDDVVRWRKHHGFQHDTITVRKDLQIKMFL